MDRSLLFSRKKRKASADKSTFVADKSERYRVILIWGYLVRILIYCNTFTGRDDSVYMDCIRCDVFYFDRNVKTFIRF